MVADTFKFNLPSGPECEVSGLFGLHQGILTKEGSNIATATDAVLADIIKRVGSVTQITEPFVKRMASEDRKLAFIMARQFSLDFPKSFVFVYEFEKKLLNGTYKHDEVTMEFDFPADHGFNVIPAQNQIREYSELIRNYRVVLPKTGKMVDYQILTGESERLLPKTMSSHVPLIMRNVREVQMEDEKEKFITLDLDRLPLIDIEALRSDIKGREGVVESEVRFRHPDADELPLDKRWVSVELSGQLSFLFPSGRI